MNKTEAKTEIELYYLWYLINILDHEKFFYFQQIVPFIHDYELRKEVKKVLNLFEEFKIKIDILDFDDETYEIQVEEELSPNLQKIADGNIGNKECLESIKNIASNDFNSNDLYKYVYESKDISLIYYTGLKLKITKSVKNNIQEFIDSYLESFIENNIFSRVENIFTFEIHKNSAFKTLYETYDQFGDHFIITSNASEKFQKNEFLFLHFLFALDYLKYIQIQDIKVDSNFDFSVRIYILPEFFENTFRENEKQKKEKPTIYNDGILNFKGKKLNFNSKRNQKELLDILYSSPTKVWYYDEIKEQWDTSLLPKEIPNDYWRKFYTAGDGINNFIAKNTTISDFIIKTTKDIQINKSYLANS